MNKQAWNRIRKIVDAKYKTFYKGNKCYYCGDMADTIDHAPDINKVYAWGEDRFRSRGIDLVRVSCCSECNTILGHRSPASLQKRCEFVYRELLKKYDKFIMMPNWYDEDCEEVTGILVDYIENSMIVKRWIERRLEYMEELHKV